MGLIESFRRQQELIRAQQQEKSRAEEEAKKLQTPSENLLPMLKMVNSSQLREALSSYIDQLNLPNPPIFKPQLGCGDESQGKDQPRRLYASIFVDLGDAIDSNQVENNGTRLRKRIGVIINCIKDQFYYCFHDGDKEHVFASFEELLDNIKH
jgi:hypothetical protein